ncbi:MAG: glycoside hydrolase family 15 protein [Actinomycetota bacterium]
MAPRDTPIERYGVIGDAGTAALVSETGSIDWLCLPAFDNDPVFARLLDPAGGHCAVVALGAREVSRRYLPGTPVLETTLRTASGSATVTDFFVGAPMERKQRELTPFRWLVRRIEGISGRSSFEIDVAPRDAFGDGRWDLHLDGKRFTARMGGRALFGMSTDPLVKEGDAFRGRFDVTEGQVAHLSIAFADRDVGIVPPIGAAAEQALRETVDCWSEWSRALRCPDRYRGVVERSAITLKLLTFAPTGGVVAAPTTSLPESIGEGRNWDYRYVWIRDASRSVLALLAGGHAEDARAYLFWLANATRLAEPRVDTLYGLTGGKAAPEREILGLSGYAGSRPVRKGNAAADQLQLDNWGYVAEAALAFVESQGELPWDIWPSIRAFAEFAAANWQRPDHGIWEFRDRPRHFVHSKVMCWVALDRAGRLARLLGDEAPLRRWDETRRRIEDAVLRHGVDPGTGSFVRAFDDPVIDASLLELPIVGFIPGEDPRVLATIDRVRAELGQDDLLMRYVSEDGLRGGEGAFLPCSFWLAHALAIAGRRDEAQDVFERACGRANDLGLLPEEIDPTTGAFLGNFPQGLTHLALLGAAAALDHQPNGS